MKLTFWGTRGSIPAPGPYTVRIGGNTTCLEVSTENGVRIVVDAGTGIRSLGLALVKNENPDPITLLLTHSHWDHLEGFTFFAPAYHPAHSIDVYGNRIAQEVLRRDIFEGRDNRYFPVNMDDFRAEITFHDKLPEPFEIGDIRVVSMRLNHPGNGYAYRFEHNGRRVAFITDNELGLQYQGGNTPEEIEAFCRGVDVLIHDAQFLPSEIEAHRGWGHSTYDEAVDLAHQAGVPHILLTHHDPERDDDDCDALLVEANKYVADRGYKVKCEMAIEGRSLEIG